MFNIAEVRKNAFMSIVGCKKGKCVTSKDYYMEQAITQIVDVRKCCLPRFLV